MRESTKTISLSVEEYNNDIVSAQLGGQKLIMGAVKDIIETGGANTQLTEQSSDEIKYFVEFVKNSVKEPVALTPEVVSE